MNHLDNKWWQCIGVIVVFFSVSHTVMADEPVVVGVVHRTDFAYAEMMQIAYDLALEEINAADGVNGRMLQLIYADDRGEAKAGEQAINELIKVKKAVMLVGGYSSSNTLKMAYEANRLDTPFLVCTAADDRITQHKLKNIYRLNPPVSAYTSGLEELLLERVKPATMSIIYENSPFGTGSAMRMMWFCRENEIAINFIQPYDKRGASAEYIERILAPVQSNPPDVLFMSSYLEDAILLVNKIDEMKIPSLLSGGAGGFTHEDLIRNTKTASENLLTATLWSPAGDDAQTKVFIERFVKQHGTKPDYHAVEAYSALLVAAAALRKSPSLEAEDIRTALESTRMKTPFGDVAFSDHGLFQRQNASTTPVFQVHNGNFETVWPVDLKTMEVVLSQP
jgi:branched-chain amino acid transport system substrate-binding protein